MPPKKRVEPTFEHYLASKDDGVLSIVIRGHLVIEGLLLDLIDLKLVNAEAFDAASSLNFPGKVALCIALGLLPEKNREVYMSFNTQRNRLAHRLGHTVTFDDVFGLVKTMASLGYDFSDDTIHLDRKLSEEWYGVEGGLIEILNNLSHELAWILEENGGPSRF